MNTNISAEKGTPAIKIAAASVEKVRKPRKGSAGQDTTSCKFYIGEIKDGLPVMSKEVSEKDALLDCVRTQRPFMMVLTVENRGGDRRRTTGYREDASS